ncbi:WHG domain-containing protein [Streptomyces sp. NBC_00264]|nr:TetR-like C-terminal domain-containing protein [Streptomyces sp. ADI95-17]MCX5166268.1 WHG domain-containing protein [Streptomyces sp. NBC_00305]MCX5224785.1 WHG domain-containing protein [Streptomyces sp. NBC_00264]
MAPPEPTVRPSGPTDTCPQKHSRSPQRPHRPCDTPDLKRPLRYLPPPVTALLLIAWGHLHGLVALEVFRHTSFLGDHHTETFRTAMRNLLEDIHRRIAVAPAPRP